MSELINVAEIFGKNVFNETVMREYLPKGVFKKLKKTIEDGAELDPSIADVVAHAMKDWAIRHGATHYTHWFQPLTGVTAEKHDSFISAPNTEGTTRLEVVLPNSLRILNDCLSMACMERRSGVF